MGNGLYKTTLTVWSKNKCDSERLVELCEGIQGWGDLVAYRNGVKLVEDPREDPDFNESIALLMEE
jgi:hypothetical protein